eukprot:979750-Pelagomonas_calceolata.AAC.1
MAGGSLWHLSTFLHASDITVVGGYHSPLSTLQAPEVQPARAMCGTGQKLVSAAQGNGRSEGW